MSEVAADIEEMRLRLQDLCAECVFNIEETGIFKVFLRRTYVLSGEDLRSLRGTKAMKAKESITAYVCNDATGREKFRWL